jgi:hypothetical protein
LGGSTGASLCEQLVGIVLVGPKCRLSALSMALP